MSPFSDRLRQIRESYGITQNEFSKRLGISRVSLTHYEAGDRTPDIDFLKRLHEETGFSLYYLLCLSDSKDDGFANTQKETGLSEHALQHFASHRFSAKVVNHLVECGQMGCFSHEAAIIHDDAILFDQYKDKEVHAFAHALYNAISNTPKKSLQNLLIKAMATLYISPEPFGVDPDKLPARLLEKYAQNPKDLEQFKEAFDAQETPEQ